LLGCRFAVNSISEGAAFLLGAFSMAVVTPTPEVFWGLLALYPDVAAALAVVARKVLTLMSVKEGCGDKYDL
jgi:hypothetical protein